MSHRLPLNELMTIFRNLSNHQALTRTSKNWSTLATIFSSGGAWAMYWYMSTHHDSLETEMEKIREQRYV